MGGEGWGWEAKDRWWRKRGRGEGKRDGELDRQREAESVEEIGGELDRRRAGSVSANGFCDLEEEGREMGVERENKKSENEWKQSERARI